MSADKNAWSTDEVVRELSQSKVGIELSEQVVQALKNGKTLMYGHRDYCGVGLRKNEQGGFEFCYVDDGLLALSRRKNL